ncbi:MAG TPA: septation protein A [Rhizomicrobium sp.]|nr:septation protein A [Rhizomicrobium sp.]
MNPQVRRLILDFGPLVVFLAALSHFGIFKATAAFMVAVLVALAIGYGLERKLSPAPLFTATVVMITGGLTLYFKNEIFIKMKPTLIYGFFGLTLLGGLLFNRLFIKYLLTMAFELNDAGWKKLTLRWGVFFLVLMSLNELLWRNVSTTVWAYGKIGMIALTVLFAFAQAPLLIKHQVHREDSDNSAQD